jgi:hypothetical protein
MCPERSEAIPQFRSPSLSRLQWIGYAQSHAIGIIPIIPAPSYNINRDLWMHQKTYHNWVLTIIPAPSCNFNPGLVMRQKRCGRLGFDDYSSAQLQHQFQSHDASKTLRPAGF